MSSVSRQDFDSRRAVAGGPGAPPAAGGPESAGGGAAAAALFSNASLLDRLGRLLPDVGEKNKPPCSPLATYPNQTETA